MISRLRRDRGHALGIALVVLVLVGVAGSAIAVGLQLETRASQQESHRIRMVALTDAALAEALAELSRSKGFRGAAEHRLGAGTIGSSVRQVGLDLYEITATAALARRRQEAVARVDTSGSRPRVVSWEIRR